MVDFDCIVVGAGIVGASCFARLTEIGLKTLLLDRSSIGTGCSGNSGAVISIPHSSDRVMKRSFSSLLSYQRMRDKGLLPQCRNIRSVFLNSRTVCQDIQNRAASLKVIFNAKDMTSIKDTVALIQEDALILDPHETCHAIVALGAKQGGEISLQTQARKLIQIEQDRVVLEVNKNGRATSIQTIAVVLANGLDALDLVPAGSNIRDWFFHVNYQVDQFQTESVIDDYALEGALQLSDCAFVDNRRKLNYFPSGNVGRVFSGQPLPDRLRNAPVSNTPIICKNQAFAVGKTLLEYLPNQSFSPVGRPLAYWDAASTNGAAGIVQKISNGNVYIATGFTGSGFRQAPEIAREISANLEQALL